MNDITILCAVCDGRMLIESAISDGGGVYIRVHPHPHKSPFPGVQADVQREANRR
jgi:hypothetical protein